MVAKLRYSENSAEREEREHSKFSVENYACFMNNDSFATIICSNLVILSRPLLLML